MKVRIRDADAFRGLNPHDLAAYLRTSAWREVETKPGHSSTWAKKVGGEEAQVLLPLDQQFRDFVLRMADAVAMIAAAEDRSQLDVLSDLQEASTDIVRVRLCKPDAADGSVPLDQAVPLIENVQEMMLAAACAAVEPRARFATRKPDAAVQYVRGIRLGQTERGSYVVKVLSRVPPALQVTGSLFGELDEPFERKAVQTLGRALRALRAASDQAVSSAKFDAFTGAVKEGVSSNLCEALVKMGGPIQPNDALAISWVWARSRPADPEPVREVTIPGDRLPVIAEAARLFRASAPLESVELRGVVVKLEEKGRHGPLIGPVTIKTLVEGEPRRVNITLAEADHLAAHKAYASRATVACTGDLVKQGGQFVLLNPKNFTILDEE